MSTTNKAIAFLLLTFAFSWSVAGLGWSAGLAHDRLSAVAVLALTMAGPAIAAIVCAFAFDKGSRVEALGLTFRPNWWWLGAFLIPFALAVASVALTIVLSGRHFVDPAEGVFASMVGHAAPERIAQARALPMDLIIAVQVVVGAALNAVILTFTEELGWRGYLHHLWRRFGFWRASLATGVVWGVWHAPAIYFFGLNYPDNRVIGIPIFIVFCTLLAPLMTLIRDRGGSTWAAGIAHGTINAMGGLTAICLSQPEFPWVGIVGIGGLAALALALLGVIAARPGLAPRAAEA